MISVDLEKCTGCGVCESVCPANVFSVIGEKVSAGRQDECIGCKNCESSCPMCCIGISEG